MENGIREVETQRRYLYWDTQTSRMPVSTIGAAELQQEAFVHRDLGLQVPKKPIKRNLGSSRGATATCPRSRVVRLSNVFKCFFERIWRTTTTKKWYACSSGACFRVRGHVAIATNWPSRWSPQHIPSIAPRRIYQQHPRSLRADCGVGLPLHVATERCNSHGNLGHCSD